MNTRRELDRIVIDWLQDRTVDPPHDGLREAVERVAVTPQQRHGRLAAVLDRIDELLRGPDPFISRGSRQRVALSAASVGVAVALLAFVAVLFLPRVGQGPELSTAGVVTHVVAADGSGDFGTIGEAVAAADDGDRIVIEPGTYPESIVIDKDVELTGDPSDASAVVVQVPGDAAPEAIGWADLEPMRYAFLLRDSSASLRHLTVESATVGTAAVIVDGGEPAISDLVAEMRSAFCDDRFVLIGGAATGTIERNESNACVDISGAATPIVRDNALGSGIRVGDRGSAPVLMANRACWILVDTDASATIEDNEVGGCRGYAVEVGGPGTSAAIRGNTIHGSGFGIAVYAEATATISGNTLHDNDMGATISSSRAAVRDNVLVDNGIGIRVLGAAELVEGNSVTGGDVGILVSSSGKTRLVDNNVEGATRGVAIERWASPTLEGNRLCGNEIDLWLAEGASPEIGPNDICGAPVEAESARSAATHVVAADGSGDFTTIAGAVAEAVDGDRIVVEPGTYTESVIIDKDVELLGDRSDASAVVVRVPDDGPVVDVGPYSLARMHYAFLLDGSDASIGHLSIDGPLWYTAAIIVDGGEPTIHDVVATVIDARCENGFLVVRGGAGGTVRDNHSNGCVFIIEASSPIVMGNVLTQGVSVADVGSAATITANRLGPVTITNGASAVVEDNDAIARETGCAIAVYDAGTSAAIRGNRIEDCSHGICIYEGTTVSVEGNALRRNMSGIDIAADDVVAVDNELTGNTYGISVSAVDARVEGNRVAGGTTGVVVLGAAAPSLIENSISDAGRGIAVGRGASPVLTGNDLCGNEEDISVAEGASPRLEDNTTCGVASGSPHDEGGVAE